MKTLPECTPPEAFTEKIVLAAKSGESIQIILEKAIENYQRQLFLEEANQAFAALRNDPEAWQAEMAERSAWDVTLGDGLE